MPAAVGADTINIREHQMNNAPGTPQQLIEQRVDFIIRELDQICKMAVDPETSDLIAGRKFELKEIVRRSMRAILLVDARKAAPFRRHSNVA